MLDGFESYNNGQKFRSSLIISDPRSAMVGTAVTYLEWSGCVIISVRAIIIITSGTVQANRLEGRFD
jgi:hypothetical protein